MSCLYHGFMVFGADRTIPRTKQKGRRSVLFVWSACVDRYLPIKPGQQSGECFYCGSKAAFMASGLVFMNDVLVGNAIDNAGCFLKDFSCDGFVAGIDRLAYALDRCAKHRAQAGVVFVALNRLASTFAGLGCIGHD